MSYLQSYLSDIPGIISIHSFIDDAEVFESIPTIYGCLYLEPNSWAQMAGRRREHRGSIVDIGFCPTTSWRNQRREALFGVHCEVWSRDTGYITQRESLLVSHGINEIHLWKTSRRMVLRSSCNFDIAFAYNLLRGEYFQIISSKSQKRPPLPFLPYLVINIMHVTIVTLD